MSIVEPEASSRDFRCDRNNTSCARHGLIERFCQLKDWLHAIQLAEQPYGQTAADQERAERLRDTHVNNYVSPSNCDHREDCTNVAADFARFLPRPASPMALGMTALDPRRPMSGSGQA